MCSVSCIPNILRTAGTLKKLRDGFLSYTKNYLPAKNKEHSMISISVGARQKFQFLGTKQLVFL